MVEFLESSTHRTRRVHLVRGGGGGHTGRAVRGAGGGGRRREARGAPREDHVAGEERPARERGSECTVATRVGATVGRGGGGDMKRDTCSTSCAGENTMSLTRPTCARPFSEKRPSCGGGTKQVESSGHVGGHRDERVAEHATHVGQMDRGCSTG